MKVQIKPVHYTAFAVIFIVYMVMRLLAWDSNILLKDTDSLSYLRDITTFLSFDIEKVINLDPDSSLFYPFLGALFSLPGWSVETGARLATLFSGIILFVSVLGIGLKIAGPAAIAVGLLFLAINPEILSHAFTVLTEPSFVATIYLGLWLFLVQYKNPKPWSAIILGIIFGLGFLNRLEGILFIAYIPIMLLIYYLMQKPPDLSLTRVASWSLIFVTSFMLLASIQILRVSNQMGVLAINGRQVWTSLLHSPIGESYDEKIYGLNFSPRQINIVYLKQNPRTLEKIKNSHNNSSNKITNYIWTIAKNWKDLYIYAFPHLLGIFIISFFFFGLFSLHQSKNQFEIVLIFSFIVIGLLAPMLHNVVIRHILIIAPLMLLVAGVGVDFLSRSLLDDYHRQKHFRYIILIICGLLVIGGWGQQIRNTFSPKSYNREYSIKELTEPAAIIKKASSDLDRPPIISARKGYLAYFIGGKSVLLPYADYKDLVKYTKLNNVDFVYLKYNLIKEFPFIEAFNSGEYENDFKRLYSTVNANGTRIELYRVKIKDLLAE
jgi:hypothetical protein